MRLRICMIMLLILGAFPARSMAYWQVTHADMALHAWQQASANGGIEFSFALCAIIDKPQSCGESLQLPAPVTEEEAARVREIMQSLANDQVLSTIYPELNALQAGQMVSPETIVQIGAMLEDEDIRALSHFYDPVNDKALTVDVTELGFNGVVGRVVQWLVDHFAAGCMKASPAWALEDTAQFPQQCGLVTTGQENSLRQAVAYQRAMLRSENRADRAMHAARMLRAVGHVMHHVQDMAQPQHVRNDAHPDVDSPLPEAHRRPSLYEAFVGELPRRKFIFEEQIYDTATSYFNSEADYSIYFDANGQLLPCFTNLRWLWKCNGAGLAEYTNRNFFSERRNVGNSFYAEPFIDPTLVEERTVDEVCQEAGQLCGNLELKGSMIFYGSNLVDRFIPDESGVNRRSTTLSMLSPADLQGATFNPYGYPQGSLFFSLNRFNYKEAYPHLLKRAVAYSSLVPGQVMRSFTGDGDLVLATVLGQPAISLTNYRSERSIGTLEFFTDDADGIRRVEYARQVDVPGSSRTIAADGNIAFTSGRLEIELIGQNAPPSDRKVRLVAITDANQATSPIAYSDFGASVRRLRADFDDDCSPHSEVQLSYQLNTDCNGYSLQSFTLGQSSGAPYLDSTYDPDQAFENSAVPFNGLMRFWINGAIVAQLDFSSVTTCTLGMVPARSDVCTSALLPLAPGVKGGIRVFENPHPMQGRGKYDLFLGPDASPALAGALSGGADFIDILPARNAVFLAR